MLYAYGVKKVYGIKGGFKGRPPSDLQCGDKGPAASKHSDASCMFMFDVGGELLQSAVAGVFSVADSLFHSNAWLLLRSLSTRCTVQPTHMQGVHLPRTFAVCISLQYSSVLTRLGSCCLSSQVSSMLLKAILLDRGAILEATVVT